MLDNPDTALPLYVLCVLAGIMLGKGWREFLKQLQASSKAAGTQAVTSGSAAGSGSNYGH